ncbi:phage tail protein [Pediococcus acidilactici]|uniref:phage tail protein n=1 Tax=Pediococcus acidilactici TaxID=1254 RepID=UPI00186A0A32|nr:phage tail protein [Pediococcus acidilactici]QOP72861.1 phage tail protein [Pediococcus acidilactici]
MQYRFRDLQPTLRDTFNDIPEEGFAFGDFDSRKAGLFLVERTAPTPEEKEITESVPYMQGVYDFSMYQNERFFENREITYKLVIPIGVYHDRKGVEQDIKRQLMPLGRQALIDTHEEIYYWIGKCKSVEADDDSEKGLLTVTVAFDCYPFAFTNNLEGADVWDDVYFDHWIWQPVKFTVNGKQDIQLENIGSHKVMSNFEVTGKVTIKGAFGTKTLDDKTDEKSSIPIQVGVNKITLDGNGTIWFKFRREELL